MGGRVLFIAALFILGSWAQIRDNFIIEGNENIVGTEVQFYPGSFGSSWTGPVGSTVCLDFRFDSAATGAFGEAEESFQFYPPGETTPINLVFNLSPIDFFADPLVFELNTDNLDPRVCPSITKRAPINQIYVQGDASCNGGYEYRVTVGNRFDVARSDISYIGGTPPQLVTSETVLTPAPNTLYGKLGATFQVTVEGTDTVIINATDFQGNPPGTIDWFFMADGSNNQIQLPGSLAGATVTVAGSGQSLLQLAGITTVHLGEYIAVATNEHGESRESAFVTQGLAPFITQGSGQSGSTSFRVGADRAANIGETITIRAEDAISDPSSTISWSYSLSGSGPYSAISSGGAYTISSSSGGNNVGTDSSLRIANVQRGHFGYYRAEAVNPYGTYTSTTSLVGAAPALRLASGIETDGTGDIGSAFRAALGSTITIRAVDTAGFPTGSFRWQRVSPQGQLQDISTGGRYQITTNGETSTLRISGVTPNELGTYRATASNAFGQSVGESLVGVASSCSSGSNIVRVANGATYPSGAVFDTTNANSFRIRATDPTGVPTGTSSFQYSRTANGPRSPVNTLYATTPIGSPGEISFFNLVDGAYGYYFVRNTNLFGSSECSNLVGGQLAFRRGNGQIGQNYQVAVGESRSINAAFADGFPYGEIVWRGPNGLVITSSTPGYTIALGNGVSQLVINSARPTTDYGQYTATATNVFGTVTASSIVSQTVVVTAPDIDEGNPDTVNEGSGGVVEGRIGESYRASSGETVTINANDIAGLESSTIRWFRIPPGSTTPVEVTNNPPFTITNTVGQNGFTDSSLSFTAGPDTYGTYRAQASNSAGTDAAVSQVGQPPTIEPRFSVVSIRSGQTRSVDVGGQVNIEEGGTLVLRAEDTDGQPDRQFTWEYRNNPTGPFGPLPATSRITEGISGNIGTLTISNIDRTIYGEYRVRATNQFGDSNSVISVVGAPPIIRFSTGVEADGMGEIGNDFIIGVDRRLTITACVIGGYPPADPADFRFEEQGVRLQSVQQDPPNDNCFTYREGEFEITCGTTISTRTQNIFGRSNEPESSIVFPPPTIIPGTTTCSQGGTQTSAQIGSELCLYGQSTFDITCSVERTNIPSFTFQWLFNGRTITSGGKYAINTPSLSNSQLTVTGINVDDTGRYQCRVVSTCGETDQESTDVSTFVYEYICNQAAGRAQCLQSVNGGPSTIVPNSVCESLNLPAPPCDLCDWIVGPWSSCSDSTCHRGRRTRQVLCECNGQERPDSECTARPRPVGMDRCGPLGVRCMRPCQWKEYSLTACSASCGYSVRARRVECVDLVSDNEVNAECCNELFKPEETVRCHVPLCDQCVNRLTNEECNIFVNIVGNCDAHPYFIRSECCATCLSRGF